MYGLVHPTEWSSILRVEWQSGQRQRVWESDPQKPHTHTRPLVLHMGDVRCYYYCCTEAPSSWYIIFYQKRFQTEVTGDNNRQSSFCRFEAQCCTVQPHRKGDTTELWKKCHHTYPPTLLFSSRSSEMCGEKKWGKEGPRVWVFSAT